MKSNSLIYVAGHTGLVGSAIVKELKRSGYENLLFRTHNELELTNQDEVDCFFYKHAPEYVFLAAAMVGGIYANNTYPAEFIYSNLSIQCNVIHSSWKYNVTKLLFLGSSCIYPRITPQPMKEDHLLSGKLEETNKAYAISKIAGIIMCQSYNKQYGTNFISSMPTNLYGPNDNYHIMNSHVIPALIRKIHEAKINKSEVVKLWGTGNAIREFLHSDDCARACVFLMNNYNDSEIINIGYGSGFSIKYIALTIKDIVGYRGRIEFDSSQPDGTPKKLLDSTKILKAGWRKKNNTSLGWIPTIDLRDGLESTYKDFLKGYRE